MVRTKPAKDTFDEPVNVIDRTNTIVSVDTVAHRMDEALHMPTKTFLFKVLGRQWIAWVVGHGQMVRRQVSSGIFNW
jgi:hypothetical protein